MENLKIDGMGTVTGGEYGNVSIDGMGKCTGDLSAETVSIDGMFRCSGKLTAKKLHCDGMATFFGDIKAENVEIDGMITVAGESRMEAAEIVCDGYIKLGGEISADVIKADGYISAREITGDNIYIHSRGHRFFGLFHRPHSHIELIEATTVELRGVVAQTVNGRDVTINSGCTIENLDCSGTLYISSGSRVRNISGNFSRKES
jgi:cytoskeletal protein CcmA (bactofilin family)